MNLPLPVGICDFRELVEYRDEVTREGYLYIDKTNFIEEIARDGSKVIIITRPRRFGKTINMSMLQYFYASEVDGKSTKELFDDLKISNNKEIMKNQGSYPVVFVSFKGVDGKKFEKAFGSLCGVIKQLFSNHRYLLTSDKLAEDEKNDFKHYLIQEKSLSEVDVQFSLQRLTFYLEKHFGKKIIVLIDEYDAPIQKAYSHEYYEEMVAVFRDMLGDLLKGNKSLKKAVLTGVIRVSKESLFSSLNNVEIYSVLRDEYSQYFGFTEAEVKTLLSNSKIKNEISDLNKIKKWYNGYKFGNSIVYNPWSIIKFLKEKGNLKSYWVNTSSNNLAEELIKKSDAETREKLTILMQSKTIEESIDEHVVFKDLDRDEGAVWSLLLASGYLITEESTADGRYYNCLLKIPNLEVLDFYTSTIKKWISRSGGINWIKNFIKALENGHAEELQEKLQDIIDNTMSFHDTGRKVQESTFHGFMLGIVASLKDSYKIKSNRESGKGRYDVALFPNVQDKPGIIMEFKAENTEEDVSRKLAEVAIKQLRDKNYKQELIDAGCKSIISLGIGFIKNKVHVLVG